MNPGWTISGSYPSLFLSSRSVARISAFNGDSTDGGVTNNGLADSGSAPVITVVTLVDGRLVSTAEVAAADAATAVAIPAKDSFLDIVVVPSAAVVADGLPLRAPLPDRLNFVAGK